jgi:hypothetical protein
MGYGMSSQMRFATISIFPFSHPNNIKSYELIFAEYCWIVLSFENVMLVKCFFSNLSKTLSIFQEAVAMIKPIGDAEEAAKRLMQEAYQRGSADNITCVVVRFLVNQGTSSQVAPRN